MRIKELEDVDSADELPAGHQHAFPSSATSFGTEA